MAVRSAGCTSGARARTRTAKRRAVLAAGLPSVAVVGAACTGVTKPAAPSSTAIATTRPAVTLRFSADFGAPGSATAGEGRRRTVDLFNARYGPLRVEGEQGGAAGADTVTKLLAQVASGTPPDVVNGHPREYHPLVNNGALLNLDRYLKSDRQNVPDLLPAVLDYWLRDGKHYAMPSNWTPQFLYFNRPVRA
jgi:ABC-type glycerol-3-phosphate transport system substrate-binding protein